MTHLSYIGAGFSVLLGAVIVVAHIVACRESKASPQEAIILGMLALGVFSGALAVLWLVGWTATSL